MQSLLRRREFVLAVIVAVVFGGVSLRAPVFSSRGSLDTLVNDGAILAIMALAQMQALVTRGVDLSIGANMALSGMTTALLSRAYPDLPVLVTIAVSLAVGLALGLINGGLIAALSMPPIVVTLGTMSIYRGLVFLVSGGAWVNAHELGAGFVAFPSARLLGLTSIAWIALAVGAASYLFLQHRRTGRELYALGSNPAAARYVGIDGARLQLVVYATIGLLGGLSGYLWVARYAVAYTETALGFEMQAVAACVIGGVSIAGGRGTALGCLLGAAFLVVVFNALPVIDVSPFWQMAISGLSILVAVVVNSRGERRTRRTLGVSQPASAVQTEAT